MDSSIVHVQIDKNETSSSVAPKQKGRIKEEEKIRNLAYEKIIIDVR